MFFAKHIRYSLSRTTITLKFKISRLLEKRKKNNKNDKAKENRLKRL